jgi:hypothetical protein
MRLLRMRRLRAQRAGNQAKLASSLALHKNGDRPKGKTSILISDSSHFKRWYNSTFHAENQLPLGVSAICFSIFMSRRLCTSFELSFLSVPGTK